MKRFKLLTFLLLATCAACSTLPPVPFVGELERNRRKWENSNIKNYNMKLKIFKSGHAQPSNEFLIEVRNGAAVNITIAKTGEKFPEINAKLSSYDTIEEIFAVIEHGQYIKADELITEYDAEYGYPKKVRLDVSFRATDDELALDILELEIIR